MKKLISLILSVAMILSCFGMTSFAADVETNKVTGIATGMAQSYFNSEIYTLDPEVWTLAATQIEAADANGTFVPKNGYYTNTLLGGSGDNVTSILFNRGADGSKSVIAMNNANTFNNVKDYTSADRIHYSFYINQLAGTMSTMNVMPINAGGINISVDLLGGTGVLNNHLGQWFKMDVFYQPEMTYTYTKTSKTDATDVSTGTWVSNTLQNSTTKAATGGVDWTLMPGYDANYTYTMTKAEHGLVSSYINGEPVVVDQKYTSQYPNAREWDNLAGRIALYGTKSTFAMAKAKCELIRNFDASTYDFVDYPELTNTAKYSINGSNLVFNQSITAADIVAPAGCKVGVYADSACTTPVTGVVNIGDTVAVADGVNVAYYTAGDGKNIIATNMSAITRSTHSTFSTPLAGKDAPFTKITKGANAEENAFFEVSFGSKYPSIDTEKYYVLEMNYLPESDGAYLYFGGQQSGGLGVANLTLTNGTLVKGKWNKIVVVLENGSTEANPYPANKKDYASAAEAKAASPHTLSLYCNGKLVTDKAKTQLGMIWSNNGRQENFFRVQVLPTNKNTETYAYVDDVVLYAVDELDIASTVALPEYDMTKLGGFYYQNKLYLSGNVADINAIEGLTVLGKTEGMIEAGDVVAYTNGKDVAYYTVAGNSTLADRDGNPGSIGWKIEGTTLHIYDIPDVGTARMANGQSVVTYPWNSMTGITDVVIEDGINHLATWAIMLKGLNSVTVPASVVAMDSYSFNGAVEIEHLIFEEGAKGFGTCVLNRDSNIKNLYLPSTAEPTQDFWRGINLLKPNGDYNASNKAATIHVAKDTKALDWANEVAANSPAGVTVTVDTEYSDRLYTFVRKSYLSGITLSNGVAKSGLGASGNSYDTSIECYSTTVGQNNGFISGTSVNADLAAKRDYIVFEADVKFTENTREFFFASNQHKCISPYIKPEISILKDGWNKVVTVVEYETGVSKTYINGILMQQIESSVSALTTNTNTRFVFYNNENGLSEEVPVGYVDNMAIYHTDVNPADSFTAPLAATAFDAENGVTFTASADVKALDSNVVIAVAYDADDNMVGNVVMDKDTVTIAPVSGAAKYVGYVWNSIDGLAPIAASVTVPVQ